MQLTWKSPVCAFDKIPGSFGLGITFPINEYTRALFGFAERFAKYRSNSNQKFPGFEIRFWWSTAHGRYANYHQRFSYQLRSLTD